MTEQIIECPICEARFPRPKRDESTSVCCPHCSRTFDFAATLLVDQTIAAVDPVARLTPEALVTFNGSPSAKQEPLSAGSVSVITHAVRTDIAPDQWGDVPTSALHRHQIQQRKRRETITFVVSIVGLSVLIAVFGGLFVWKLQGPRVQQPTDSVHLLSENPIQQLDDQTATPKQETKTTFEKGDQRKKDQPENDPTPILPPVPPPPPKFFFLSGKQSREIWNSTRPHLLNLDIEGPLGKQQATGTLVDSRGWVLTSHQAIKDAWKIEVTAATDSLDQTSAAQPLRDLVRGIVAVDPVHDLALLSVNRRFVISFAELPLTENNKLVQGEFLLQCGPPSRANYYGFAEVKVEERGPASALDPSIRSKVSAMALDSSDLLWLKITGGMGINSGTPLLDGDGTLRAMVSFTKQDFAYALSVDRVRDLVQSAAGELEPLKTPVFQTEGGPAVALNADHPASRLGVELNIAADACQEFDWLPQDSRQYAALQTFAKKYFAGLEFVRDNPPQRKESVVEQAARETIQSLLDRFGNAMKMGLGKTRTTEPNRRQRVNELAKSELGKGDRTPVAFFGSVFMAGIESPNVVLKFANDETYVRVPFDPDGSVMRLGTNWMLMVETMPLSKAQTIRLEDNRQIKVTEGILRFAIGPLD